MAPEPDQEQEPERESAASPLYVGSHVLLRPVEPSDASLLHRWLGGEDGARYRHGLSELCPTPQLLAERIALQRAIQPTLEVETLVLHAASGLPLGIAALTAIDRHNGKAEVSLALFRGRGTRCFLETLGFSLESPFAWLGLHKLIFLVNGDNAPVLALMERFGFTHEGVLREELAAADGARLDLHRFSLLRREWLQHPLRARLMERFPHLSQLSS